MTPTVGAVRSLKRTPVTQITLDGLLNSSFLPPFSLREFEDFLVYEERSVENLYATVWCRAYARDWADAQAGKKEAKSNEELRADFQAGMSTFFSSEHSLEVNLPAAVRTQMLAQAQTGHDASILVLAQAVVEEQLRESMTHFVAANLGNAEVKRTWFAIIVGVLSILLGIGLVVLFCLVKVNRAWRTFALPLYWLGMTSFYGGLGRSCIILFLFGAVRQLHPWEMDRSPADTPEAHTIVLNRGVSPSLLSADDPEKGILTDTVRASTSLAWYPQPDQGVKQQTTCPFKAKADGCRRMSPLFAPVTAVLDPVAIRSQRDRMLYGMIYGLIFTAVMAAPTFAVPNRG